MRKKLYYIDALELPGQSAHSLQVMVNIKYFQKHFDFELISYKDKTFNGKSKIKHIAFFRPKFFRRIIPYSVFHLLYKIRKLNFQEDSFLFTRNVIIAFFLSKKFKKTFIEIHDIPSIRDNIFYYIFFKFWLEILSLYLLKKKKNVVLITISHGLKKELIKKKYLKENLLVLPDGVDLEKFDLNISKVDARNKLSLPQNKKILLYVGSFQKWKGIDTLLEASAGFDEDVVLIVLGGSKSEVNNLKHKYPKVIFKGYTPNELVPIFLKVADILVLPNSGKYKISSHFTSPLKLFEYMASKRPIIASNLPSIKEVVSSKDVLYFTPDDYKSLLYNVRKLLKSVNLQKLLAKNSYDKVKDYTWESRTKKIMLYIKENGL